ncbi:MAG TPA: Clp protease N-terminal domain-containing protein [Phycisphaerales bacterium]|nr:Clp protease N-terminal domain-containing protein [Phycisphaerales bacterium]
MNGVDGACPECGRPVYRFTDRAREVVALANQHAISLLSHRGLSPVVARRAAHWSSWLRPLPRSMLRPRHVLAALARGPHGLGYNALLFCRVYPAAVADRVDLTSVHPLKQPLIPEAKLPVNSAFRAMVNHAIEASFALGHTWVGTEHLLLALIASPERFVRRELAAAGVTREAVCEYIRRNAEAIEQEATAANDQNLSESNRAPTPESQG